MNTPLTEKVKKYFIQNAKRSWRNLFLCSSSLIFIIMGIDDPAESFSGPLNFIALVILSLVFGFIITSTILVANYSINFAMYFILKQKLIDNEHLQTSNMAKVGPCTSLFHRIGGLIFKDHFVMITELNGKKLQVPIYAKTAHSMDPEESVGRYLKLPIGGYFLPEPRDQSALKKNAA